MNLKIDWSWLLLKSIKILPKVIIVTYVVNFIIKWFLGKPIGLLGENDFLEFWVASSMAAAGKSAAVYHQPQFYAALAQGCG